MASQNHHTQAAEIETAVASWQWLTIALIAQLGWGAYPAFLRYLQTVSLVPSLSLLAVGNGLVLLLVLASRWRQIEWRIFRLPLLWLFGGLVVLRGITNLLATRYTLAIYAQLIYLMTPFIVALLSRLALREQLPRHTFKALTLCLVGAVLMLSGNLVEAVKETAVTRNDWLGISLAIASSFFLALYMIVTRRTTQHQASGDSLLLMHLVALSVFSGVASLVLQEDWQQWRNLQPGDWLIFGLFALGVLLGANLGQIRSIQHLGAPLVSSTMTIRLVSALVVGNVLLNERLSSGWQLLGAAVVFVTLTWYLRQRNGRSRHIHR
ncbi:MAG: DMT family transporter [Ardenticatenaceae bacterium]|nr:DMT family transporter [Anaerolineales bacterium]MCB8937706.1 DMT family transporter [Ardenticatenaceae bacterium]MCB8974275.1 DMT family transporter [Ardenticatenaceae bacterium]